MTAQQGRMVKLNRQPQKAKDTYFADAMDIAITVGGREPAG